MPSESTVDRVVPVLVGIVAVVILLYSVLVVQRLLLGVITAAIPVLGYVLWHAARADTPGTRGEGSAGAREAGAGRGHAAIERRATVGLVLVATLVFGYSLLVVQRLLLGVIATTLLVCAFYAWRIARTLERLAANVEDGGPDPAFVPDENARERSDDE